MCVPQISIIVPVYKAEKTIKRCIASILTQTFGDLELILIDDGSPDASGRICDEMAQKDERIVVIHKENGGVSSARNAGLDVAKGKYLMFCDSDDYVSPQWCQWMYRSMELEDVYMAICTVKRVSGEEQLQNEATLQRKIVKQSEFIEMLSHVPLQLMCNKIFRTDIVKEHGLSFDTRISRCEDILFILDYLKYMQHNQCFSYGSDELYYYVISENGLSTRYIKDYLRIELQVLTQLREVLYRMGIDEEIYMPWYSKYAAILLTNVIANIFLDSKKSLSERIRTIRDTVSSTEYEVAIQFDGLNQVAPGRYASILKSRIPILIYIYNRMSAAKRCCTIGRNLHE